MSLDVYLKAKGPARGGSGIFVRQDGQTRELTREEWDAAFPGREPVIVDMDPEDGTVFEANITHNLNRMAQEAGIYEALWRPEEIGITHARQLIEPLRSGYALMEADPPRFKALNPDNGWGSYDGFLPWIARYLQACVAYPDAEVRVSR